MPTSARERTITERSGGAAPNQSFACFGSIGVFIVSQVGTLVYLGFFLLMPWWSRMGTFKPVPERVTYTAH